MKRTICGLCFALSLTGPSSTAQAATTWVQIDSPHFTFISSDNEGRTRDIARQFEQIRTVVATLWPWTRTDSDRPVMVLCVADDDGIKRLAPSNWKPEDAKSLTSVFQQAPERYYIGVRSDARAGETEGINPYYNAYWSYVGLTIRSSVSVRLPDWFVHGIAGIMANTLVRANEVQVGRILPAHLRQLRQASRIRLRQLIVDETDSPAYADPTRLSTFSSESTVLLNMLLFGDDQNKRAGQVDAFLNRLRDGEPGAAAFEKTFGSPETLENEFVQYFGRSIFTFRRLPADLRVASEKWPSHRLTVAEASTVLAGYHVAIRRFDDAAGEIRQAREADKALVSTLDVEALLLDQSSERDKARAAFEKAAEAGSTSFYTYYRLAQMLSGDTSRATVTRRETLLERSVKANGRFSPGHAMLSEVKAQLGKASDAVDLGRKAVEMEPNAFGAHYALARALAAADHPAEAIRESRQAGAFARDDSQRQAAAALRKYITDAAIARMPALPKASAAPAGALRVGGEVQPPVKTKDVRPIYPDVAAAAEIQGVVILEATIGADGKVAQATVLRSVPGLDAAALEAVRQWEFQPRLVDGDAVPLIYTVTVNFALQ